MGKNGYTISLTKHHILREIWTNPGISRTDLSQKMELNKSTITKAIADLEDIGILETAETGDPGPRGGRRRIRMEIAQTFGFILGAEIRTDKAIVVAVSLQGAVLHRETISLEWESRTISDALATIFDAVPRVTAIVGMPILGVGIGLPGTIDPEKGIVYYSGPLEIDDPLGLAELCRKLTDIPVLVENDGNCCAWGELVFRKRECPEHFLYVLGEFRPHAVTKSKLRIPAIGLALVLDRKLQYGQGHCKGEFQSIFHTPGFLNSFSLSDEEIRKIEQAPERMELIIRELAKNLALLVNVLNLDAVIVGGNFEEYEEQIQEAFLEAINQNWPAKPIFSRQVLFSRMKDLPVAYGAAAMFVERLFAIPSDLDDPFANKLHILEAERNR